MFAIWADLSRLAEIQSMIAEIQCAIPSNADAANRVQEIIG